MTGAEIVMACLQRMLETLEAHEDELGQLDAAAGDGDHGAGMVRGMRAAVLVEVAGTPGDVLGAAGAAFSNAAGGASGALYGMGMMSMGNALKVDEPGAAQVSAGLKGAVMAIGKLGKAEPGDKTMLDTLDPFVTAYTEAVEGCAGLVEAWRAALPAAKSGMESTAAMVSKRGRSSRLGDRSKGHIDAGAASMYYLLAAVGAALNDVND